MPKPVGLGGVVDKLYALREKRLALNRQADEIKEQESALTTRLLQLMAEANTSAARGKLASASRYARQLAKVADVKKFLAFVQKEGDYELATVGARLEACKDRWEAGQQVPGVTSDSIIRISLTKNRSK